MTSQDEAWTIGRLIEWTVHYFAQAGVESPRLAAQSLLAHATGCKRIELYTRFEAIPPADHLAVFRESVRRAAQHEPIAYLIGKKEFYSIEFEVTPAVLIPRPETEVLVDQVIQHCRSLDRQRIDILDLGTGSGCIGLTLCCHVERAVVIASDISQQALQVAGRNAEKLHLQDRFKTVRADCLDLPANVMPEGGFDVLVSNPPYVAVDDADSLCPKVRKHEPQQALFAGADGLEFYRRMASSAAEILKPAASIFVEIGYHQHDRVVQIMTAADYRHIESWRDFIERHLRVIRFDRKNSHKGTKTQRN